jgi:hypothetical protein
MDLVEIRETDSVGKAVVAKQYLAPGLTGLEVFREKALVVFPQRGNSLDGSGAPPWPRGLGQWNLDQNWTNYWWWKQQSDDVRRKVMSFYVEIDGEEANRVRSFLKTHSNLPDDDVENQVRLLMVTKFNAVTIQPSAQNGDGQGQYFGSGLFEVACRLAHSCHPNCVWFSSQDGSEKIVRLIENVRQGDMLTVDYVGNLEKHMHLRRGQLQKFKNFACLCKRCLSDRGDDSRRFYCAINGCNGVYFASQLDSTS